MNYESKVRTNYVRLQNILTEAVSALAQLIGLEMEYNPENGTYIFLGTDATGYAEDETIVELCEDHPCWAVVFDPLNDDTGGDWEVDLGDCIYPYLVPGEVLVVQCVGSEGYRYLVGWTKYYDHTGFRAMIDLGDLPPDLKPNSMP